MCAAGIEKMDSFEWIYADFDWLIDWLLIVSPNFYFGRSLIINIFQYSRQRLPKETLWAFFWCSSEGDVVGVLLMLFRRRRCGRSFDACPSTPKAIYFTQCLRPFILLSSHPKLPHNVFRRRRCGRSFDALPKETLWAFLSFDTTSPSEDVVGNATQVFMPPELVKWVPLNYFSATQTKYE
jgi:hypothetical protein